MFTCTMLASRCVSFYETIEASSELCIRFLSNLCKNDLNTVLGRNLFYIANDCSVNPSDLSKMLAKKQLKYFDVPLEHAWKVPVLQELLNTRMNNLYVAEFYLCIILHIFFSFLLETCIFKKKFILTNFNYTIYICIYIFVC